MPPTDATVPEVVRFLRVESLRYNPASLELYGPPEREIEGLVESIREQGLLVPLVVTPSRATEERVEVREVVSGHRRLAAARSLGFSEVPCLIRRFESDAELRLAIIEYNRQRRKTFSQTMREADSLEAIRSELAQARRLANLRRDTDRTEESDRRNSDDHAGRTDESVAKAIGLGGKDLYRQARAIWKAARSGDPRACNGIEHLDSGTKTVHAAYKDLRRRDKFTSGFQPTPYDVWSFKHDRAYGIPHPGDIPPGIVAHLLYYYSKPGDLVVDPMAGGGTTVDVCQAMGRRCLAYDLDPVRPEILRNDVENGLPDETRGCDLIFVDPPYHTMLARKFARPGVADRPLADWFAFLNRLARVTVERVRPGGFVAILLADQTEKDLPAGYGYLDHAFFGYQAMLGAGFLPERRISCPMSGGYLPQQIKQARADGRMLGLVRDLLVMRKPPGTA